MKGWEPGFLSAAKRAKSPLLEGWDPIRHEEGKIAFVGGLGSRFQSNLFALERPSCRFRIQGLGVKGWFRVEG